MAELTMKRILAAVDLGSQSEDVLSWARWLAKLFGAEVDVVHAVTFDLPPYFTESETNKLAAELKKQRGAIGKRIKHLAARVLGQAPFSVTVREGLALEVIRAVTQETKPDLLVIGSHRHSRLRRMLLGSVAENLFREAPCPTLVVKSSLPAGGVNRILCPVNFSEVAADCARYASAVAERADGDLFLLQAIEQGDTDLSGAQDRLCQWHREGGVVHAQVAEIVRRGDPVKETVTEAQRNGVNLIMVGAQHRRMLDFLTIGRTTEQIVRLSPISVLVVPANASQERQATVQTPAVAPSRT
jgi:nucleotide-binding universal stress UspA family protein